MDRARYLLKVTLRGSRPAIWRRIDVDDDISLFQLHRILQVAMGWTDGHLHQFRRGSTYYGESDPEFGMRRVSERRTLLKDVLRAPRERMAYEYDFGDGWEHDVVLERVSHAVPDGPAVSVLAGKGACPPEDVGGIGGYYEFLEAIQDPHHPEHTHLIEWGGAFDPDGLDLKDINARLATATRRAKRR